MNWDAIGVGVEIFGAIAVGRHLLRLANYRILRARAFVVGNVETCA